MKSTATLLFLCPLLWAGDAPIAGVIVDPSARPVEGAQIACDSVSATTDAQGRFRILGIGACQASITKPGFQPIHQRLESGPELRIRLALALLSESVVVSATRTAAAIEDSGVSATVITKSNFADRQYPRLFDTLRETPGLTVIQTGRNGGTTSVFARGSDSNSTLVLLDGVSLNEPGGQIDLAHILTTGLERVEIVRGPASALYGAEGSSAVVQMFSQRGDPEARWPHGSVSYERGSFQSDRWTANLNGGALGRVDYSLTADQTHTAGEFSNDAYRNTMGTAAIGFRFSDATRINAVFRGYDSFAGVPGQVAYGLLTRTSNEEAHDGVVGVRLEDASGRRYFQTLSFGYHRLRDRFNDDSIDGPYDVAALLKTNAAGNTYLVKLLDPANLPAQIGQGLSISRPDSSYTTFYPYPGLSITDRTSAGYQGTLNHNQGSLVFGYSFEQQAGQISGRNVERENNGVYFLEQQRIGRLYLTGGARVENSSIFGTKFTPKGSASYQLRQGTFLRFSAGRGIKEPALIENFARETYYIGNPKLRPEKTTSLEAGVVQEFFHSRVKAEVSVFRNQFDDLITFLFGNPSTWQNIEKSWARGLELSGSAKVTGILQVSGAYTRLYTRIVNSVDPESPFIGIGRELLRRPRDSGSLTVSFTPRHFTVLAGARFIGERQDNDFLFGINRNPGFQSVFFSGSWQATRHLAPFLRIDNLAGERYEEALGYSNLSRSATGGLRLTW